MTHTRKIIAGFAIGFILLLSAACSSAATPTSSPTVDMNPFRTEVASTVLAQVSRNLALTPSPTQCLCPTETLEPTSTAATTQSLPTIIVPGPQGSGTPGTETINLAEWVSQTVSDGTVFEPGETFIITWTMKNAGTSTWTPNYMLRYFSGNAFGAPQEIFLDRDVLPGETVDIAIAMQAPTVPGDYRSDWVMADPFRSNFKTPVYLEITVARPPTATPTATVTPTATRTPTTTITPTVTATP